MAVQTSPIPVWKQLDRLRADLPLSSQEFIQGLAALIFLRWADFQEAELEAMAAFDDSDYEPVFPVSLHWRTWHQLPPEELLTFLARELPRVLSGLNNSRHNPLATQLHLMAGPLLKLAELPAPSLAFLIQWLADQPFETPLDRRQLLDTFDQIFQASQDKYQGEFRTPPHVVKLMVALAEPAKGERVYDPCFGSAGLLTCALDSLSQDSKQAQAGYGQSSLTISGVECNEAVYIVGLTRLVLAGAADPQLEYGDSLLRPPIVSPNKEGFDLVLADPPWGWTAKMDDRYGLEHYPVMTKDSTGLFIQHALASLRPNGRAIVAVPNGLLFKGGAEQQLRKWLLDHHTLEAVISLPETTFLPSTAIKASLLVLRRGGVTKQVRMMDAASFFQKGKGRQPVTISESRIQELVEAVRAARPSESCWDVEVESLASTDYDLTPRRRDQSGLQDILSSFGSSVKVVSLKECCQEIMLGRQVRSADLMDEPPLCPRTAEQEKIVGVTPIPFIRIKDIHKGQAGKGTSWLAPEVALGVETGWKLRAGDVLLSKSGTIGKVGVVRNGAVGAVAASGLYVLRVDSDRLDPHFLAAYLDCAEVKAWLQDYASGGVISHLNRRVLENTPVPLPPLDVQRRMIAGHRESGKEFLGHLGELLSGRAQNPILDWVQQQLDFFDEQGDRLLSTPLELSYFNRLALQADDLARRVTADSGLRDLVGNWFTSFAEGLSTLKGIDGVPPGPGLFGVLQEARRSFATAYDYIKGRKVIALYLHKILDGWLADVMDTLVEDVSLHISPYESSVFVDEPAQVRLFVRNDSALPLRNVHFLSDPDWGGEQLGYFQENSHTDIVLKGFSPKNIGTLTIRVGWEALRFDGQKIEGSQEVALEVVLAGTAEKSVLEELGSSPYVCGDPIRPERNDVFFGREELLGQIRRQIIKSGNVVLLEGNRRAGKSSILRHLEGVGPVDGWLGVYCSLQGAEGSQAGAGVPTEAVFREVATCIAKGMVNLGIETPLPDGSTLPAGKKIGIAKACREGISAEHPFADFRDFAEIALETVKEKGLGILLMLDEFDKLQEGIDNGVTSPQVPENIRFLVQTYPGFSAILTGSRRLKRLREEYWSALFGLGTRFGVTSLSYEAASLLVVEPVKGRLVYSEEAVNRAIMLTNRQPFLLQSLCNRIFDMAAQLNIRSITLDLVEKAATLLADDNEHFRSLWNYAETDCRRFILGLIHRESSGPDLMRFGVLLESLANQGVVIGEEALGEELEFLRELELVEKAVQGDHYSLAIPLMGRWIDRQHDFEVLRNKARIETEENNG